MPNNGSSNPNDDVKTKLRKATKPEHIWQEIKEAMINVITLEIETKVTGGPDAAVLSTRIDLIQADRKNEIHRNFLKDPELAPLRDFHAEQVKLAESELEKRLNLLFRIGTGLVELLKSAPAPGTPTPTGPNE